MQQGVPPFSVGPPGQSQKHADRIATSARRRRTRCDFFFSEPSGKKILVFTVIYYYYIYTFVNCDLRTVVQQ
jgi:hypothetical protein